MLEKLHTHLQHPWLQQLRDFRSLGLVAFALIALLVSYSGVQAIESNYKLQQQIASLQQQNNIQQLQNTNQKLKNNYYNTPQYLELAARENSGLALPGETELIVPKEVAMAHVKGVTVSSSSSELIQQTGDAKKQQPFYQRNVQAWMDFFLHRQSLNS